MDSELTATAVIGWNEQRELTSAEGTCERVLGAPPDTLIGQTLEQVLEISGKQATELDARARSQNPAPEFISLPPPRARVIRLALGCANGAPHAGVIDLTALLAGAPPLQLAKLSSSLSHEIRNPLSSVKMAVQTLAKNTTLSERDQRRLTIANREIRTMERMLWLFSEYGREIPPTLEAMPLRGVIGEAAALIEPELAERRIALDLREEPQLPKVRVDAGRLRPVLAQTLLNAAIALAPGSTLVLELRHKPGAIELVVEDATFALMPEERPHLFEPFGSRLARGAGLSLAALQRVMLSFGGELRAAGEGAPPTLLTLCFPE